MSLFFPLGLLALAAIAWPLWLHFRQRDTTKEQPFSTLMFLLRAPSRGASAPLPKRAKLRHRVLLGLRILLVVAAAFVLAGPARTRSVWLPAQVNEVQSAIVIIDNGATSQLRQVRGASGPSGGTLLERWQEQSLGIVSALSASSEVLLLPTHAAARGGENGTGALRPVWNLPRSWAAESVEGLVAVPEKTDWAATMARVQALFAQAAHPRHVVYALGLPPKGAAELEKIVGAPVLWADSGFTAAPRNVALTSVRLESPSEGVWTGGPGGGLARRITVELASGTAVPISRLPVELRVAQAPRPSKREPQAGGPPTSTLRKYVDIPSNSHATVEFSLVLPRTEIFSDDASARAPVGIEIRSGADALAYDNGRYVLLPSAKPGRVLLLRGTAHTQSEQDELFYLEAALRAAKQEGLAVDVHVRPATKEEGDGDDGGWPLDGMDIVFLCNIEAPSGKQAARLTEFVERGGGLVVTMGDRTDAAALRRTMGNLLPSSPVSVRTLSVANGLGQTSATGAPPSTSMASRTDEVGPAVPLPMRVAWSTDHPALRAAVTPDAQGQGQWMMRGAMPSGIQAGLTDVGIGRIMMFEEPKPPARTIARLSSGIPLMLERPVGKGHVLVLGTSIDRDWTDFPIRPLFVPLVAEWVRYLAHQAHVGTRLAYTAGEPLDASLLGGGHLEAGAKQVLGQRLGQREAFIDVTSPSGRSSKFSSSGRGGAQSERLGFTNELGFYSATVSFSSATTGASGAERTFNYVVNIDPSAALGPFEFPPPPTTWGNAEQSPSAQRASARSTQSTPLAPVLAAFVLAFLLLEALAAYLANRGQPPTASA